MSVLVNTDNTKVIVTQTDDGHQVTVNMQDALPMPFPVPGPQGAIGAKGDKGDTGDTGPQGNPTTVNGKTGASITLVKADIGLGNVPNTDATNPANITQAPAYRFVSDAEKSIWNAKQDALAFTPEDVALKQNDLTSPDSSHYTTTQAVSDGLSTKADLVNGKVPLSQINDALIGNVHYKGLYSFVTGLVTSDDPALDGQDLPTPDSDNIGWYFISADSGTLNSIDFITGDWIISNGSLGWHKVDNTDAVSSVNGYTGNVVLNKSDIGLGNVPNVDATNPANTVQTSSYRYVSDAEKTAWNAKLSASDGNALYFPLTGGTITGTAGSGFIGLIPQSSNPATPASGVVIYSRSTGALSWKGTNGYQRSFVGTGLSADRDWTLPDCNGTLALASGFAGGQTLNGGTGAAETLTLSSTSHATKGQIKFGTSIYDEVNNYLGITGTPLYPVHVFGTSSVSANIVGETYAAGTSSSQFLLRKANGTAASPSPILANDRLGLFGCAGWDGSVYSGFTGVMTVVAEADWVQGSSYPSYLTLSTTASGATGRSERLRITSAGLVGIGTTNPAALFTLGGNPALAMGTTGNIFRTNSQTVTDSTTAAGTLPNVYGSSFGSVTFATSGNAITATRAATVQINAPAAGPNVTITNAYSLILGGALAMPSSTNTRAPLNMPTGTPPGTPIGGDIWAASNKLKFFYSGSNRRIVDTDDTTPANGRIPIGNGTDYTVAALTQGNGMLISVGAGTITIATEGLQSKAGDPTTTDVPASTVRVYKNTSTGAVKLWANDAGTLKSVTLS